MSNQSDGARLKPALFVKHAGDTMGTTELAAVILSVVWVVLSGWYFLFSGGADAANLQFLLVLMVVFLPVALIWVAATAMRTSRIMQEESARLQAAIDAIRQAYVAQAQSGRSEQMHPDLVRKLNEISGAQKHLETTLAMMISTGKGKPVPADGAQPQEDDQPALSLGTPAEALNPPLSNADFIRALHFPETAEDQEGFNALRRALRDHDAKQLVQSAQDVLTLMSQDGIYMDDLRPDMARPEIWRAFAKGARGRSVAALGGVRDRSSLALTAGRMKTDPIFRDAAHHFLRRFDKSFAGFEQQASDSELSEFANTRTARAFMLLGRVAGTFD